MEFYDIALAKLLQTLPELSNYIVTFKDASEDIPEGSTMKVGIFILRSGKEYMYVPVVAKDENIYPIDSIFFENTSKFYPLTKKTLSVIETLSQSTQGKAMKIPSNVVKNPDMSQLINPPRTGKFVYSSSSRLGDFLQSMPDTLKRFTIEKIASEHSMYENLHQLFGLKDIFDSLKMAPASLAAVTNVAPVSILDKPSIKLSDDDIQTILHDGYVVSGHPAVTRVAVSHQNYLDGRFKELTKFDGNHDYEVMLHDGNSREAFIPESIYPGGKISPSRGMSSDTVAIFTNGDFAVADSFIGVGEMKDRKDVLTSLFDFNPPVLPKDIESSDTFMILTPDSKLVGIFRVSSMSINNLGVEIRASSQMGDYCTYSIHAYRNFSTSPKFELSKHHKELYIPYASIVVKLGKNITGSLEVNVTSAHRKREINEAGSILGDQINLGFDGVEFIVNRKPIGNEAKAMELLVVKENIDPAQARTFIKQARETRLTRIYLSKSASDMGSAGADIPQFGVIPPSQADIGLNGSFVKNVQTSMQTNDSQVVESTIISELLQTPDMFEMIGEYIPDIEECVDRLGRILLLSRVNIEKLADNNDADSVFAFLAQLKATYRMLGDNLTKLKEMITTNQGPITADKGKGK